MVIDSFSGQYRFLSNFWPCTVVYDGIEYPSTEHAFQALKTLDKWERVDISEAATPSAAKRMGRAVTLRPDWEQVKDQVMLDINRIKFSDPELKAKLLSTGNATLIEGNTWGDTYWGVRRGKGKNMLGQILMMVRKELEMTQNTQPRTLSIMVTGHRKIVPEGYTGYPYPENPEVYAHHVSVYKYLIDQLAEIVRTRDYDAYYFINGMAIGADQLFGWASVKVREMFPDKKIYVVAAIPFAGQESRWKSKALDNYHNLLKQCDHVEYVCDPGYAPWKMQKRNEWMVDRANCVVALWTGINSGGTYNCVEYASKLNRQVLQVNPSTLTKRVYC